MKLRRTARLTAALAVVAGITSIGVPSALAVSGTVTAFTGSINLTFEGGFVEVGALITLTTTDGDLLQTYCIDAHTITETGTTYDEGTWTQANVPEIDSVTAILQNAYPVRSLSQLQTSTGIAGLTVNEAIAGTQGAIWHFTDALNLDRGPAGQNAASNIGRLYDYLLVIGTGAVAEPASAISITPASLTGTVGTRVGPFTLHATPTNSVVAVTNSAGVAFTDGAGNAIVLNHDGQQFWVTPPAVGNFSINASAEVAVPTGRVFLHPTTPQNPDERQKLVLATSTAVTTTATASVGSTAVPPTTTTTTTTTTLPTTPTDPTTTTVAGGGSNGPATTTTIVVAALPPVPAPPTNPAGQVTLPATGSSSQVPSLIIAACMLMLGIGITALARRRVPG